MAEAKLLSATSLSVAEKATATLQILSIFLMGVLQEHYILHLKQSRANIHFSLGEKIL